MWSGELRALRYVDTGAQAAAAVRPRQLGSPCRSRHYPTAVRGPADGRGACPGAAATALAALFAARRTAILPYRLKNAEKGRDEHAHHGRAATGTPP